MQELGAAEHPDLSSYHQEAVGLRSPTSAENLKEKPVSELVKYLKEWEPRGEFMGPSREGLGDILSAIVSENPAPYAKDVRLFQEVVLPINGTSFMAFETPLARNANTTGSRYLSCVAGFSVNPSTFRAASGQGF